MTSGVMYKKNVSAKIAGRMGTASAFPTLHSIKTQWRRK